ncbi:MAG: serine--tRNA ligase [Alphaproteobacteria bacterium]|nr:serine--tRNA ligase [Alphaproteobacteria bacterium]
MHDIRVIRDNPAAFDAGLARRHLPPHSATVLEIDQRRRAAITEGEQAQARRKALSKQIGAARGKGESADALMAEVAALDVTQKAAEATATVMEKELNDLLSGLPNIPSDQTPDGKDEHDNVPVPSRQSGAPRNFAFEAKDHVAIGEPLGMDFAAAAKLSGARFVVLRGQLARLERAIGQYMIDLQTRENGYTEIAPPLLVRDAAVYGTNNLPKFADDLFTATRTRSREELLHKALDHQTDEDRRALAAGADIKDVVDRIIERAPTREDFWLIPTAEVPLTNLVADSILDEKELPLRFTALTPCFRSEAGSAGKDTRGMIRQHQFIKVELVSITTPEQSEGEHERMTDCAQSVLKKLDLPHRVVTLCAGDMGFGARKTYDIEVWLPGQGRYREISSCSNTGDFQARRMGARYRPKEAKGNRFVHTLNGSGLAVGRTLVAILENFQNQDGSVTVPEALRPYMGGVDTLRPA